jgi:hypothetical protein
MIGRLPQQQSRSRYAPAIVGGLVAVAGAATAAGGKLVLIGLAIALLPFVALLIDNAIRGVQGRVGIFTVEVPLVLLLVSDMTFRVRTTEDLSNNPFDAAGIIRAALQCTALFLALVVLLSPGKRELGVRLTTRPFRLYCAYVIAAAAGIAMSQAPVLTAYRVFEVVVAIAVIGAALHNGGSAALPRVERALYWWLTAIVIVCWLNAVIAPHSAILHPRNSPLHWQLQPVFPVIPANSVGFLGLCLAFWSGARLRAPKRIDFPRPAVLKAFTALGVITLLAAQYRTGYVALVVGIVVLLAARGRKFLLTAALIGGILVAIWAPRVPTTAESFALRGAKTTQLGQLNGRVNWWSLALPVWHTSPIIGRGLLTATRFALASGGFGDTNTIHNTWVETVVGTGIAGTTILALALLVGMGRGFRLAKRGDLVPLLLLVAIAVRSITGNTVEAYRMSTLFFIWAVLSLRDRVPAHNGPPLRARPPWQAKEFEFARENQMDPYETRRSK